MDWPCFNAKCEETSLPRALIWFCFFYPRSAWVPELSPLWNWIIPAPAEALSAGHGQGWWQIWQEGFGWVFFFWTCCFLLTFLFILLLEVLNSQIAKTKHPNSLFKTPRCIFNDLLCLCNNPRQHSDASFLEGINRDCFNLSCSV